MRSFELADEEAFGAFLHEHPRVVVFWRGVDCEYSAEFRPAFAKLDAGTWTPIERWVEHGAEGPVGDRYQLNLTPTLVAYRDGVEASRLEAVVDVGIMPEMADRWVSGLRA